MRTRLVAMMAQMLELLPEKQDSLVNIGADSAACSSPQYTSAEGLAWLVYLAGGPEQWRAIVACASSAEDMAAAGLDLAWEHPQLDGWTRDCILHAREQLRAHACTRNAILALRALLAASLREALTDAVQSVRCALVWRAQLTVGWGDKEAFLAALECAYGKPLDTPFLDSVMLAHYAAISRLFPSAYLEHHHCFAAAWTEEAGGPLPGVAEGSTEVDMSHWADEEASAP